MQFRKVTALVLALFVTGGGLHAQKILVGADFATRFDNREYANNDFNESPGSRRAWVSNGWRRTGWLSAWTCSRTSGSTTGRANRS